MAMAGIGIAGHALGGIFGAAGSKKLRQKFYLNEANDQAKDIAGLLPGDRALDASSLADYTTRQKGRAADYARLGKQAEVDFGSLLEDQRQSGQDPLNVYNTLRSGNLGALQQFGDYLGEVGRRQQNTAKALLGYAGDRGGSYADALGIGRLGSVLGGQFGNIISGLTPATATVVGGRQQNLGNLVNLINQRTATAGIGEGTELSPAIAGHDLRQMSIADLAALVNSAKANTAGFYIRPNWADRTGEAFNSIGDAFSMGGGGGGGGMGALGSLMGGMGGGGGGGGGSQLGSLIPAGATGPGMAEQSAWNWYNARSPWGGGGLNDQGPPQYGGYDTGGYNLPY